MEKRIINEEDETRRLLGRIRSLSESKSKQVKCESTNWLSLYLENEKKFGKTLLKEDEDKSEPKDEKKLDAIAITDDPKFGQQALQQQIDQFRSSVESGAQFSTPEDGNVAESPLIYMPSNRNLIFSGIIPCLNNLKWQFVLKTTTGNGCFIWSDGLIINKDNIQILNKLFGFYQNWKEEWNSEASKLDTMVKNMLNN